jgi:hypothetical protein
MTNFKFQMRKVAAIAACLAVTVFASCKKDEKDRDFSGTVTIKPNVDVVPHTELTAEYSGAETVTWQWNKDKTAITGANADKYTPTEAGSYTVTASAKGFIDKTSEAVDVAVRDLKGSVTISPNADVFTGSELTAAYNGTEKVTWQWNNGGTEINSAIGNKYTPTDAGNYSVTANLAGYNSKTSAVVEVSQSLKVSGTLGAGLSDYTKVSVKFGYSGDFPDEDQNYDVTASISGGTFNLTLYATPAAENLMSIGDFWYLGQKTEITISDQNAKVSEPSFFARKAGEEKQWLYLTNYTVEAISFAGVDYVYADRSVNITGSYEIEKYKETYDVKLKKGWNYIVSVGTQGSDSNLTISRTANGTIPTDCKWEID